MRKKWKGYLTVEASFIMPIILFLYLLIILAALFLYCRSAISQDNFLLSIRAGRFSWGEDDYGEVIYAEKDTSLWLAEAYVEKRLDYKRAFYPFFPTQERGCIVRDDAVLVEGRQKGSKASITKITKMINPITGIRQVRSETT
ncbi:hypothetical protein [Parablautia muri]|uniref:Pilus assembly protein n=1 Tax=Parablautia muri TaxID=2320879 RepID=A0A9X5BIE4_9FIRM|nr:hypothetical protein [Parablautia muri]NBJ94187.1 hypothetical protein [Parablautia muri]